VFDFLGSIGGYIASIASAIGQALVFLFDLVLQVFNIIIGLLGAVAQFFGTVLSKVGGFLHHLWEQGIKAVLQGVWQHIRDAVGWLQRHVGTVIKTAQHIRDRLDRWYKLYVIPYLNSIQKVRQYLHLLAALHIKIAQELDAKLAQEQAQIAGVFATIRAAVNAAIDIGNALVDPAYLIRKPALLLSIRRQLPALIHAVTGRPPGYWFPSPRGSSGGHFAPAGSPFQFVGGKWQTPPSDFLSGNEGLPDLSGYATDFLLADTSVDAAAPLDYFNDDLYPLSACTDAASCLAAAVRVAVGESPSA
jgi:hypothetical protein